jgi:hypothetical protein
MFCLWLPVMKFMELVEWRVSQRTNLTELHCSEATLLQELFTNLHTMLPCSYTEPVGLAVALRFKCPGSVFFPLSSVITGKGSIFAHLKALSFRCHHWIPIHFYVNLYKLCRRVNILTELITLLGARGGAIGWGTALQVGRSRVRFPVVSLEFSIDTFLPAALWPWSWPSL